MPIDNPPYYQNLEVDFFGIITDTDSGVQSCILSQNQSGTWINKTTTAGFLDESDWGCPFRINFTVAGTHSYFLWYNDTAGNSNITSIQTITILSSPISTPEVHYIFPPSYTNFTTNSFNLTMNVTGLLSSQVDSCWATIDDIKNTTNSTMTVNISTNLSINNLADGIYSLDACCNNTDGTISYGAHENYFVDRINLQAFQNLADFMTPFFVSRPIFTGSGKIGFVDERSRELQRVMGNVLEGYSSLESLAVGELAEIYSRVRNGLDEIIGKMRKDEFVFHISQRADFFSQLMGLQT